MALQSNLEGRRPLRTLVFSITLSVLSYNAGYNSCFMAHDCARSSFSKAAHEEMPPSPSTDKSSLRADDDPDDPVQNKETSSIQDHPFLWNGEQIYLETAQSLRMITDKVGPHTYQVMYGKFLLPYYYQHPTMKLLEIGLGCTMRYGAGAGTKLHQTLFPNAELWEAEYNAKCVNKSKDKLEGIHVLIGDQSNVTTLNEWIKQSGGQFDVVIDDWGHKNCQIWTSFLKLWPEVKPGGLYFIEDLQVSEMKQWRSASSPICDGETTFVPEKLKEFIDDLMYDTSPFLPENTRKSKSYKVKRQNRPTDIKFIFCQSEACVLGKKL